MKKLTDGAKANMPTVPRSEQLFKCEKCGNFKRLAQRCVCTNCKECCVCKLV